MCEVGDVCRRMIQENPLYSQSSSCLFDTKCTGVERIVDLWTPESSSNGDGNGDSSDGTSTRDVLSEIIASSCPQPQAVAVPGVGWRVRVTNGRTKEESTLYAVNVVLATGGTQTVPTIPTSLLSSNPSLKNCQSKFFKSDDACTDEGVRLIEARLLKAAAHRLPLKVVIIGGSHSAFSAAWVCLNKVKVPVGVVPASANYDGSSSSSSSANKNKGGSSGSTVPGDSSASVPAPASPVRDSKGKDGSGSVLDGEAPPKDAAATATDTGVGMWPAFSISMLHRSAIQVGTQWIHRVVGGVGCSV